ncbi:hypothetical protein Hte_009842 [Hypoxylon texense]
MGSYYASGCTPFTSGLPSSVEPEADAIRRNRHSRQDLETFVCMHTKRIEDSIKSLARYIFISNFPVQIQWDIVRFKVDTVHTFASSEPQFRMRPFRVATLDDPALGDDEDGFGLCIRIQLPDDIQLNDRKATLMRDALIRDEQSKYRFLTGVPMQEHPIFGLFSIQLTKNLTEKDVSIFDGTVWSVANAVFLPVPETTRDRASTMYLHHHMNNQSSIGLWRSEMDKARMRVASGVRYVEREAREDHHRHCEGRSRRSQR